MRMLPKLLLIALAANLTGCAAVVAELQRDPRDAPWDPRPGQQLITQIPNWEGGANRVCCGWETDCERRRLNPRC